MKENGNRILEAGMVLNDKWAILEFIGKGGMGEVYRAHQLNLKRDVAIKVVSKQWLKSLDGDAEEIDSALKRFHNEVQSMAQVRHTNVLQVYDHGSAPVRKGKEEVLIEYIVMEYMPGATLRTTMSEEGFYPEEDLVKEWVRNYFLPVLYGVQALHETGIIHRDLKPENILLDRKIPKIADFGLARSNQMTPITRSMDIQGTAPYMSLEQFMDFKRTDHRTDIYALGKILYEAVECKITSETKPFKSARLSKADTPFFEKLDRIIQDATAEEKEERLESVERLRAVLLEAIESSSDKPIPVAFEPVGRFSALRHKKWVWVSVAVVITTLVTLTTVNLGLLRAERSKHQQSKILSNTPPTIGSKFPQVDSSLPSQPLQRFPDGSVGRGRMWDENDDCEVGPGQRQWW
jgi:serine/threonine-protein kinase